MPKKRQFSLKGILVIIGVLSVPLALISTHAAVPVYLAGLFLFPVMGGSIGYLASGTRSAGIGVLLGLVASIVFSCVWPIVIWGM